MEKITRRAAVFGGAAAVASASLLNKPGSVSEVMLTENQKESNTNDAVSEKEAAVEHQAEDTTSEWFKAEIKKERPPFERDVHVVRERIDNLRLIQNHFNLGESIPETVRKNLESLITGLAFAESRFDESGVSDEGASGLMQLMPETRREHQGDVTLEGEAAIIADIETAGALFTQTYRHLNQSCAEELAAICKNHFNDDHITFEHFFVTPLVVKAYKIGMGNAQQMLKQFATQLPTPESTAGLFDQEKPLTGFDVFIAMSHTAYNENWDKDIRERSIAYTPRVYAGYEVLREEFTS